jgi:hypothetical protein
MAANYNVGDAILGSFQAVQQGAQNRFDNQYKNRVLDLDNRDLAERQRQFDLAKRDSEADRKLEQSKFEEDQRQFNKTNPIDEQNADTNAALAGTAQYNADTQRLESTRLQAKDNAERFSIFATNEAERFLSSGYLNDTASGLNDDFFAVTNGKRNNRNEIIDILNLNSEALISQYGDGQFKDMEVAGFEYDESTKNTKVLLRPRATDEEIVPATVNASDDDNDPVIILDEDQFREGVNHTFKTEIHAEVDQDRLDLSQVGVANLAANALLATTERDTKRAVTARLATVGNAALLRSIAPDLAETEDDPEARAALLEKFGMDPAQFATAEDPVDPTSQYLGPDKPILDPLANQTSTSTLSLLTGGAVDLFKNKDGQQTEFSNLVSELQSNFQESEALQGAPAFGERTTGEEREARQQELSTRRAELIENIPNELAKRKVAREAYAQDLNKKRISQPQVDKALAQYDAYIEQLEGYIPPQEKVVVDVAAEIGKLSSMGQESITAAINNGTFPISQGQISAIREYLVQKNVTSLMDLEKESITTRFAVLGAAAATADKGPGREAAIKSLLNAMDTGYNTLDKNQEGTLANSAAEIENKRIDSANTRTDKAGELDAADRVRIADTVPALVGRLNDEYASRRELPPEATAAQREERKKLDSRSLMTRTRESWQNGAGSEAYRGLNDSSISANHRESYGQVFDRASVASIAALLARKDKGVGRKVVDFLFDQDTQEAFEYVGLMDNDLDRRDIRTTSNYQDVVYEVDRDGTPTRFQLKDPAGGTYSGYVTGKDLRRTIGVAPYNDFIARIIAEKKKRG